MWYDFVSQADTKVQLFVFGIAGFVSQAPMLFIVAILVVTGVVSMTWNEILKARALQARWDAERIRWDSGIKLRR